MGITLFYASLIDCPDRPNGNIKKYTRSYRNDMEMWVQALKDKEHNGEMMFCKLKDDLYIRKLVNVATH